MTEENGLHYMRTRYYSPELKRFVSAESKDTLSFLAGSRDDGELFYHAVKGSGNLPKTYS